MNHKQTAPGSDIIRKKNSLPETQSHLVKSNLGVLKMLQDEKEKCNTLPHKPKDKVEPNPRNSKSSEALDRETSQHPYTAPNIFADYTTMNIRKNRAHDEKAGKTDDLTTALQLKLVLNNLHKPAETTTPFSSGETLDDYDSPVGATERLDCCVDYDGEMMPPLPSPSGVITDAQGLIVPKKLTNPCLIDPDRQSLHRELMFNQKVGRSVLNQKTELQKALEKQKERQIAQQLQQQQQHQKATDNTIGGELAHVIMQRAQRLENMKNPPPQDDIDHLNPVLNSARARLRHTVDTK